MIYAILILIIALLIMIILIQIFDMIALRDERDAYRDEVLKDDFEHPERLTVIGFNTKQRRR